MVILKVKRFPTFMIKKKACSCLIVLLKGLAPKCKAPDQYGDNCEVCGSTYSPTELINPRSVVSGSTPVMRETEHYFFDPPQPLAICCKSGSAPVHCKSK